MSLIIPNVDAQDVITKDIVVATKDIVIAQDIAVTLDVVDTKDYHKAS